ncbi:MAG TPA: hypothetical protein VJJ83_05105, partial [Candidatus Babeliales bacterium]|nr:hypothetical protein [Candidatus Babeliales bacterium]
MLTLSTIQFYLRELLIFRWLDLLEISMLAGAIYYFARWLQRDPHHRLAPRFFGLCLLLTSADYLGLSNLSTLLLMCWPLLIMLLILVHRDTLQKNFVAYKKIVPAKVAIADNWIENLVAACLLSPQKSQQI